MRVFAYFQNLVLIACFLGFGLGCYQSARKKGYLFEGMWTDDYSNLFQVLSGFRAVYVFVRNNCIAKPSSTYATNAPTNEPR